MYKLYVGTGLAIILMSTSFAFAEGDNGGGNGIRPILMKVTMMKDIKKGGMATGTERTMPMIPMMPNITTGDATVDAELKALNKEMEAKIKAIRDEYAVRIKAILGDRKPMMASTTPRKILRDMASSTKRIEKFMGEQKDFLPIPKARGATSESEQNTSTRIKDFFRGFLGNQ